MFDQADPPPADRFTALRDGIMALVKTAAGPKPTPLRAALAEDRAAFPQIRTVSDYARLRAIGRVRHRHYLERRGATCEPAVRDGGCLLEPQDFDAVNLFACDGRGVTAALRVAPVDDQPHAAHFRAVARAVGVDAARTLTGARHVVAPRHSGRHGLDLVDFVRLRAGRAGWRYMLLQTAEPLAAFFERRGFARTGIGSDDPCAGRMQTMILDVQRPRAADGTLQ